MSLRTLFVLSAFVFAYLLALKWEQRPVTHAPGVLVAHTPSQVSTSRPVFELDGFAITPRAEFNITARVLGSERYRIGAESELSPIDLALGWGVMSDSAVLDEIKITQSARWYRTRYQMPAPVSDQQIITSSSNMHMIPASSSVEEQLKSIRVGEIVQIDGLLVDVDEDSGWRWRTSLTREDTGAGACEIVFVESVIVEPSVMTR